jgi:pantoate--beta-alanine ligase
MIVAETIAEIRAWESGVHAAGRTVALVPTMGAFTGAHLALIRRARDLADEVVVSIFVNPTQFEEAADLEAYPRSLEADIAQCEDEGAAMVFAPSAAAMYPDGDRTFVEVSGLSDVVEGAARPGHFRGVATVVLKLFSIVQPEVAVFGWKDAQQFLILRRMVEDLHLPIRLEAIETVREPDGLAMSSRNRHLSEGERVAAPALHSALQAGLQSIIAGGRKSEQIEQAVLQRLAEESARRA